MGGGNMNDVYQCIKNLYTRVDYGWIDKFYDKISCFAIAKVISRHDGSLQYIKYLTKYIYRLTNEHSLILLHALLPKGYKAPWIQYTKKKPDIGRELHDKIMKYLGYSEREYAYVKKAIERNFNGKLLLKKFGLN